MTSLYVLLVALIVCLIAIVGIHIGYVKHVHRRFTSINLAYLFSLWEAAMLSITVDDVPSQSIPAGSQTEDPSLINVINYAITDYLQTWHWAMVSMFTVSRLPVIKIAMSVSHQTTYLDDLGNQVAYAFQVTLDAAGDVHSFPLVVSNRDVDTVVRNVTYHDKQLDQLVNRFMRKE